MTRTAVKRGKALFTRKKTNCHPVNRLLETEGQSRGKKHHQDGRTTQA
ncbi:MAG: hypothetical protein WBP72_02315 [Rhodocyclaceae bacterium]